MTAGVNPGLLFVNFGGPRSEPELEPFLRNLLADVLPGPDWLRRPLAGLIAPRRAARVQERYESIGWSPTTSDTIAQAAGIVDRLGPGAPPHAAGMMFTEPTITEAVRSLLQRGVDQLVVVGLFPHWSFATTGAAGEMVRQALLTLERPDLPVHVVRPFFEQPAFIAAVASTVSEVHAVLEPAAVAGPVHLLISAHGIPVSFVRRGDPYPDQVRATCRALVRHLGWTDPWHLGWQSRLGPNRWLAPSTPDLLRQLASSGARRVLVVPVSFVGEHIETLHEIDQEYAELAHSLGISTFVRARALGTLPAFLDAMAEIVRGSLEQFDRSTCVRCLVPVSRGHHTGRCTSCGFDAPPHLATASG